MRSGRWALALVVLSSTPVWAEWQVKPFVGTAFGGTTTFVDVEDAAGRPAIVLGTSVVLLGRVVGLDVDFSYAPGFFESGERDLVVSSSVTTLAGGVIVALPRSPPQVGLRPYVAAGGGMMHVRSNRILNVLRVARTLPAVHLGGGVTGFLTDRLGLNWEVRYFRSVRTPAGGRGVSFGQERLAFWRGTMALIIRY